MMRQSYQERRDFMVSSFNNIENMSCPEIEGAFYAFPKVDNTSKSSEEVASLILDKAVVVGVPGSAFGITRDAHIRFSFAEDLNLLKEAVERHLRHCRSVGIDKFRDQRPLTSVG